MEELSDEYVLGAMLNRCLDREELLIKKYSEYYPAFKDNELKEIIKEFKKNAREHMDLMKDKMSKLNI